MSQFEGKYKGKLAGIYTNEPGEYPRISVGFSLTHQWNEGWKDWEELASETGQAYKSFPLGKTVAKTMSAYDVSVKKFEEAFGVGLFDCETIEELVKTCRAKNDEHELILEADEYKSHKVKHINKIKGKNNTVTLKSLQ